MSYEGILRADGPAVRPHPFDLRAGRDRWARLRSAENYRNYAR
ncbi:MAG: hypothetical protein R3F07_20375 [Opitutaceae bacterium]